MLLVAIWSVDLPIYNMWLIALDSHDDIFSGTVWPEHPSLESFPRRRRPRISGTSANFWHQFGNSFYRRPDGDVPDAARSAR